MSAFRQRQKRLYMALGTLLALCQTGMAQQPKTPEDVSRYIRESWQKTIRFRPSDSADHIGLPHPYTVPCMSGRFQEMYYWDTYFTNAGLLADGEIRQAINNTENLASMVTRFGKILNGSRFMYQDHSQPPYLCMMVSDIFYETRDTAWLARMYPLMTKEYEFWMSKRMTPCGLNRYSNDLVQDKPDKGMAEYARSRTRNPISLDTMSDSEMGKYASDARSECESGWDFTPRFENRCGDFCPVDLNSNLYFYETHLARFARLLGKKKEAERWTQAAVHRKRLMLGLMYNAKDGMYYDYDFVNGKMSTVKSASVFSLLFANVLSESMGTQLAARALAALEYQGGLVATARDSTTCTYQWAYPNGWAPLHYLAIRGLRQYGMERAARRIARKYVSTLSDIYTRTGTLWEKYNAVEGNIHVNSEGNYDLPPMMGWTAGVFEYAWHYLNH